ncbi:MAG: hypothetical protein NTY22_03725 [Proteobacteria bacterium]|nr:hypothetical protein [Pseudomonadota bacterium]
MGKTLFFVFPVLFFLFSCSTINPKVNRAIARRSLQAAYDAGAQTLKCSSKDYYDAERNLKMGERWLMDKNAADSSDDYFKKATSLAEQAEEEALFCGK